MTFIKYILISVVSIVLGAAAMFYGIKMYPEYAGLTRGQAEVQKEVESLLVQVGKLIALPTDENPTIATVSDAEKVKTQAFFKQAMNGDKVLIYTNAKKAILFRPSENKIVEVGAVNINQAPKVESTPSAVVTSPSPAQ